LPPVTAPSADGELARKRHLLLSSFQHDDDDDDDDLLVLVPINSNHLIMQIRKFIFQPRAAF
jgi:hypothetical protein